jgi:uncharacterized cupredoxin-like copper-binding protein
MGVLTVLLLCAGLIIVALALRPSGGLAVPQGSRVVHVDERDFHISVAQLTLTAGNYIFVDTNHGPSAHELVIWKTTASGHWLPMNKDHRVNENSPELDKVLDSGSSLASGETRFLTTTLDPGHYVVACNLPGHYLAGMHADLTVT